MLRQSLFATARHLGRRPDIVWLDLGDLGELVHPTSAFEQWQDHGLGLLRTILHRHNIATALLSTRTVTDWNQLSRKLAGYRILLMNVRSYTYPTAVRAARLFKKANPDGLVLTGGMHASVAPEEMKSEAAFDRICQGPGEKIIVDLVRNPADFPRLFPGTGTRSMADWPTIDRKLWPKPSRRLRKGFCWPLEPECGWGPAPVATMLTSRVCPWQCAFCNESAYIPHMGRKPVDLVIDELNELDERFGPIGSVVIHDSMFFQNPSWLREWIDKYPCRANRTWPYWAAGRADTIRQWPELFEKLVTETNWDVVSIGFESGSNRVLRILNKECTEEDNYFAIALLDRIGDELELAGRTPPRFWANIMFGIPGETREDAFKTMRMLKTMKRALPSISYYAPYPGSVLGHQIIAEGRSLMSADDYHRWPDDEKMHGIDYDFYRDLLAGRYDAKVNHGIEQARESKRQALSCASDKA